MPSLLEILKDPNYVNANEATKEAIFNKYAPQDSNYNNANDATKQAIRQRFGLGGPQAPAQEETTMVDESAPDFTRGIANILPQIKSTYYGAKVMAAKAAGDKEMLAQAAKDYGEANKQAATKESDSFTKAWEKGLGTVVGDWLPYQMGAGVGSLLETLASMGIGAAAGMGVGSIPGAVSGAVGKSLLKKGIKEQAEQIIKDAATKEAGEKAAQAFIEKEAKKALRSYGATAGIASQSAIHGAGEVTGRAVEELEKQGKTAEDLDLTRVAPAAIVHGVADFVADKIALGALKGLSGKSTDSFIKDVTKAIGVTGLKEVPPETIQTIAERYGAALSLADAEALLEYVDTAAAAFAMSAVPGGIGGTRTYLTGKKDDQTDAKQNEIQDTGGAAAATTAETVQDTTDTKTDANLEADLAPTIIGAATNPNAKTETATTDLAAAPAIDPELAAMKAEYDKRQAEIDAGTHKNVPAAKKKNEALAKKIADKEQELLTKKPETAVFTEEELAGELPAGQETTTDTTQPPATPPADTTQPPAATKPNPLAPNDPNSWQDSAGHIHYKVDATLANGKSRVTELIDQEQAQNIALKFTDSKGNTGRTLSVGFNQAGKPYWSARDASDETIKKNIGEELFNALGDKPITNSQEYQDLVQRIKTALEQTQAQPPAAPPAQPPAKVKRAKSVDEVMKLGYMEQPSYYADRPPADVDEGIVYAGREEGFDLFDTVDYEGGVVPEIKKRAKEENARRDEENKRRLDKKKEITARLKSEGKSKKEIDEYLRGVANLKKLAKLDLKNLNPLDFISKDDLVSIYRENAGKKDIRANQGGNLRKAHAQKRKEFVDTLTQMQQLGIQTNRETAFRQEVLSTATRGADRNRRRMTETEKAVRDLKKQLSEQVKTEQQIDEEALAEEAEAETAARAAEEKRLMTQAKVAEEKQKEAAQQPRRRKITVNIEEAVNETGNAVDVLAEIADDRVNDSVTRVVAKGLDKILQGIGAVGTKGKELFNYVNVKIVFGEVEGNNDGKFDPATNTITLKGDGKQYTGKRKLDQVVLHEIMHYLTDHVFDNRQAYLKSITDPVMRKEVAAAMNRLDNNFRVVRDKLGKKYNIGSMKEFIAEIYSNPNLQIDLANMKAPGKFEFGGISNMFTKIAQNIASALGFNRRSDDVTAGALTQVLDDISLIISLPTPEMQGTAVSYSAVVPPPTPNTQTPKQPSRKKAKEMKPSRDNDLNDNTGYEIAEYQHPRSIKGMLKLAREVGTWRALAQKFQNDRYPIKTWEQFYDGAKKIYYEGMDKINNIYTQITLSTSRAKNFYNRYVKPAHEALDNAIANFAKAANLNTDESLGFVHRLLEALHEPERRRVKFILTVPLSTDANLGLTQNGRPISAADRRAKIVELLDTKTLTEAQAKQLRTELDAIVDAKKPDGTYLFRDAFGSSPSSIAKPTNAQQAKDITDENSVLYNVIGLGSEKETSQEVVAKRLQQYQQHPQKAQIDKILEAMRKFNGPDGITTQLSKYSNYWSDFVSNRVAFYDFQNYAPFKGKSKFDTHSEIDELLDFDNIKMGRELQDAAYAFDGRITVSDNPVLQTISDGIRASMRAGRKELTQSIKNALEKGKNNPNGQGILKGQVKANIPFKDRTDPNVINRFKGEGTIFHYNKDGSIDVLFIEDPKQRNAIRRTYKDTNPFTEMANRATSFLGKMHTRWNYNFAPLNFVRDVITNAWAIGAEMGPKEALRFAGQIASKVVLNNAMPKAMRVAALYGEGGEKAAKELDRLAAKDSTYADMVEFIKEGGMVSYLQGLSIKSNFEELQKDMGRSGIVKNIQQLNKFLDIWVEMFELASRSAAYKIAKQNALSKGATEAEAKTRAATYAKNLANFEQVGEWGKTMGAFFMFFRPSATGAVRAIEAAAPAFRRLKDVELELPEQIRNDPAAKAAYMEQYAERQKNARIMTSSLVGLGMITYVMASMLSDDDDLGRNEVLNDNMDQWTRFARFHIPKALTGDKEYTIQIPWGFGLGAFAATGAQLMSVMYGKQSLPDALANIFLQISLDSFVPLPVSRMSPTDNGLAFVIDSITPSTVRPLVEFLINKNGLGQDIYNDANRRMGDAYIGGDKIPEIYKTAAAELANSTLGAIDWSPNSIYFLANSYADGVARLFEMGYGITNLAEGEKSFNAKTDVPLFGSFFGARSSVDTREFAKVEKQIKEKERRINMFEKNPEKYVEYISEYPLDVVLVDYYNERIGTDLKVLQTEANSIRLNNALAPIDKESLLKINKFQQNLIKHHMINTIEAYGVTP